LALFVHILYLHCNPTLLLLPDADIFCVRAVPGTLQRDSLWTAKVSTAGVMLFERLTNGRRFVCCAATVQAGNTRDAACAPAATHFGHARTASEGGLHFAPQASPRYRIAFPYPAFRHGFCLLFLAAFHLPVTPLHAVSSLQPSAARTFSRNFFYSLVQRRVCPAAAAVPACLSPSSGLRGKRLTLVFRIVLCLLLVFGFCRRPAFCSYAATCTFSCIPFCLLRHAARTGAHCLFCHRRCVLRCRLPHALPAAHIHCTLNSPSTHVVHAVCLWAFILAVRADGTGGRRQDNAGRLNCAAWTTRLFILAGPSACSFLLVYAYFISSYFPSCLFSSFSGTVWMRPPTPLHTCLTCLLPGCFYTCLHFGRRFAFPSSPLPGLAAFSRKDIRVAYSTLRRPPSSVSERFNKAPCTHATPLAAFAAYTHAHRTAVLRFTTATWRAVPLYTFYFSLPGFCRDNVRPAAFAAFSGVHRAVHTRLRAGMPALVLNVPLSALFGVISLAGRGPLFPAHLHTACCRQDCLRLFLLRLACHRQRRMPPCHCLLTCCAIRTLSPSNGRKVTTRGTFRHTHLLPYKLYTAYDLNFRVLRCNGVNRFVR